MANHQYVVFDVNNELFGVNILNVTEICTPPEIFKVPNAPYYIEGMINLRNKVYTAINLRKKLNFPENEFDENTKIIILNSGNNAIGLIVDEVREIKAFEDDDIEKASEELSVSDQKYIESVAKKDGSLIFILDLESIIQDKSKKV